MPSYGDYEENRVKHLEMVQAVVARLGGNGFLIKGWTVTLAGAFVGLAVHAEDCTFAKIGMLASLAFWGLDAYFLRAERRFRELGGRVREFDASVPPFFMGATSPEFFAELSTGKRWALSWPGCVLSWTLAVFYGFVVAAELASSFIV